MTRTAAPPFAFRLLPRTAPEWQSWDWPFAIVVVSANLILGFATFLCFVMFLKKLAKYIQRPDLSKSASTVLKLAIGVVVIYASGVLPLLGRLSVLGKQHGQVVGIAIGILGLLLVMMFVVTFIRYAILVIYLARSMRVASH